MQGKFTYVGTFRNEKRFNIGDDVFFSPDGHSIVRGQVVGVELPPEWNSDFLYKIRIPDGALNREDINNSVLKCDRIFRSLDEARDSAKQKANRMHELEMKEIDTYFNQFETR